MKIFYTGANNANDEQQVPSFSLGNYVSSSLVGSDVLGNIWANVSLFTVTSRNILNQNILIALKNDKTVTAQGVQVKLKFDPSKVIGDFKGAFVTPALDDCDDPFFEQIATPFQKPQSANFNDFTDDVFLSSGVDLAQDEVLGLWLRREIDVDKIKPEDCETLFSNFEDENYSADLDDEIEMIVDWTE